MGEYVLEMKDICKSFPGVKALDHVSLKVKPGTVHALMGENGAGKTTLLRNLMGEVPVSSGTVKWSENVEIGYYAQDHESDFDGGLNVYDWMYQWRKDGEDEQFVRGVLGQMLFSKDDIKKSVKVLSGGEKGRMLFGKIMMQRPNVIIMDEPTNHLDMESIESLNLALENYDGTLIFVSHDREFVSSLATQIFEIENGKFERFVGSYTEYLTHKDSLTK